MSGRLFIADRFDVREHKPAKRVDPRALRAKYDAASSSTDFANHWAQADALSADASLSPAVRQKLRNRSRYEVANNTYAAGMVRTLANDTIGTGPSLQSQFGEAEADTLLETAFWRWAQAVRLYEKLRVMRMAKATDGEAFAVFFTNQAAFRPVKLDLRLYEAEQIASEGSSGGPADGVFFNDFGDVVGYSVLNTHPGSGSPPSKPVVVPAADMLHIFHATRPGQHRGVPEITPALPLYAQLRRFTLAVLAAAETAADLAGIVKTQASSGDPDDIEPLDTIDIVKRQLMTLPKGWDIQQMKAEQPATTYEMFKRNIINEIARCLSMPYNVAAGDSSNYNYSSGRLDHKTYYKTIRVERSNWETVVLDVIFAKWFAEARLVKDLLSPAMRALETPPDHTWRWDGDETIDPVKDANADDIRLANHTTTLAELYARQGKDWEEQLRQRARELALMKELDLLVDLKPESFGVVEPEAATDTEETPNAT